jgi:spore germination cell wall hydrolase CwlJ-like protein
VYFEARGEPPAGQYAVAEVTMNRVASGRYPDTVCGVVYEKRWDPIRQREVAAFSWTDSDEQPAPQGAAWQRAEAIAAEVYYRNRAPLLPGATHFHATHVQPNWSQEKTVVARIGRHVFYK